MMPLMRTTLTLDNDVVALLREETERSRRPFKDVVNQALRMALRVNLGSGREPFRVRPRDFRLRPGIDPDKLTQLADELEAEAFMQRQAGLRRQA